MTRATPKAPTLAILTVALMACLALPCLAQTPPPLLIDFQARLTDNGGNPLVGTVEITASLYNVATGGTHLWQEVHLTTALAGVVNVTFGSITTLPASLFSQGSIYLGLKVGTDPEMTPRRRLASVPYAMRASTLDRLDSSTTIDADVIARTNILANAIDTTRIEDGAVGLADMAANSVDSARISDGSVARQDLAVDAVDSSRIQDGSVARLDLAADAVDSSRIQDGSVARLDLAVDAVDSSRIEDGSVARLDLAVDAVDSSRIEDGSVARLDLAVDIIDTTRLQDGEVRLADLAIDSVDGTRIADGSVALADMAANSIDTSRIVDGTVSGSDLAPAAVDITRMSSAGASAGQVLKFDGIVLTWAPDNAGTLNLPYSGGILSSSPAIDVSQMGNGRAISGQQVNGALPNLYGVEGISSGLNGSVGVFGHANNAAASGTFGVYGETAGAGGSAGVYGLAMGMDNATFGVLGENQSPASDAPGVMGRGEEIGVEGELFNQGPLTQVRGLLGQFTFEGVSPVFYGSHGSSVTDETIVRGVRGDADAQLSLFEAVGVLGNATGSKIINVGVRGEVTDVPAGSPATGVQGNVTGMAGALSLIGVEGMVEGGGNQPIYGVRGIASGSDSERCGVYGESDRAGSPGGTQTSGVYGWAHNSMGSETNLFGVYGRSNNFGVFSEGDFGGTGAKYFIHPHPTDATLEIRYVSLEGPESGTYFRGTGQLSAGLAVIDVPESFRLVSEAEGITVQITAVGGPATLWIESQDVNRITVRGQPDVEFHYFVNGVRQGYADHEPIVANQVYVPRVRGIPFGETLRPQQRQLLVDNGLLNADFTPNENLAAAMGWTLREPTDGERAAAQAAVK